MSAFAPAAAAMLAAFAVALVGASPAPQASPATATSPTPAAAASAAPGARETMAPLGSPSSTLQTPEYKVETDTITTHQNGDFEMPHKVVFSRPGSDGSADSATGNDKRGTITLIGNVVIHDNGNAPEATQSTDEYTKAGPATLTCDKLDVDSKAKIYVATGNVHFEQGARKATADSGILNRVTGNLHLAGHVRTSEGAASMRTDVIDYNLTTKHYEATGKPIVIKQPVPTPEPGSASPTPAPKKRKLPF